MAINLHESKRCCKKKNTKNTDEAFLQKGCKILQNPALPVLTPVGRIKKSWLCRRV
jgi:hypothetical protein